MANEIRQDYPAGYTLYAVVRERDGDVAYLTGEAFEVWGTGGRTAADYDTALTYKAVGKYIGDFPTWIDAGRYDVQVFRRVGGAPADTDPQVGATEIVWSGSAAVGAGEVGAAITTAQAKEHLRITHSDEDDYIEAITLAASEWCEDFQNKVYVAREVVDYLDSFPTEIRPVRSPLISVTSITYYDTDGNLQTLANTVYDVGTFKEPGRISLKYNQSWPDTRSIINAVIVTYQAGYVARANIPEEIKHAVKLLVGHLYENREAVSPLSMSEVPVGVKSLLSMKKTFNIL
jgi:uncharacterized phiE125 gp8 family phage protein